MGPFCFGWR